MHSNRTTSWLNVHLVTADSDPYVFVGLDGGIEEIDIFVRDLKHLI